MHKVKNATEPRMMRAMRFMLTVKECFGSMGLDAKEARVFPPAPVATLPQPLRWSLNL